MSTSATIAAPLLRQAFGRRARDAAQRFRPSTGLGTLSESKGDEPS